MSGLLVVVKSILEEWKSVLKRLGAPSVTMAGPSMMLMLSVNNWATLAQVNT